jgi:uncharacterized protein
MDLHHPIHREFPQLRELIDHLNETDSHFQAVFSEYHRLDEAICRIEEEAEFATDQEILELKMQRARLKDHIARLLRQSQLASALANSTRAAA